MKIHAIQCANFGGFNRVVCSLDSHSAFFTGANGAGKTTLLDALNTAFTLGGGGSKYNAAGNDAKSSRGAITRNLASYILGSADDGRLREHGAIGHVFVTLAMEPSDKAGGFLHVGCIAQARLSPGGVPELAGDAHGVSWASSSSEIEPSLLWRTDERGVQHPRSIREFNAQCKVDGLSSLIASTISKADHMAFVAKHAFGRPTSPEQAQTLCLSMASTIKIDPEWTPNGFAKKLLSSHDAAFNAQSVASFGEAARAFEAAESSLKVGEAFHQSVQRVDDAASHVAILAHERCAARVDLAQREAAQAQKDLDAATLKKDALLAAKDEARRRLEQSQTGIDMQKNAIDALMPQLADAKAGLGLRGLEERVRLSVERREGSQKLFDAQAASWARERLLVGKRAQALAASHPAAAATIAAWAGTPRPVDGLADVLKAVEALAAGGDAVARSQEQAVDALAQARQEEARARDAVDQFAGMAQGQANAPQSVRDVIALINAKLPGARARCLCDVAVPANGAERAWVDAFERVMGHARFTIVVDEGFEYKAQRLAQDAARGPSFIVEVARNDKCGAGAPSRIPFKALDLLDFGSDAQAKAFAEARFGHWQMCANGDLSSFSSGFCLDGRTSSIHTLRASAPPKHFQPCFGSAAAASARAAAQSDLVRAREQLNIAQSRRSAIDAAASAHVFLCELDASGVASRWERAWEDLACAKKTVEAERQALAQAQASQDADGSVQRVESLEASLLDAKTALAEAEARRAAASTDATRAETLLESADAALDAAEHARDQRQSEAMRRSVEANAWALVTRMPAKEAPAHESGPALARRVEACDAASTDACVAWIEETSQHNNRGWAFEFDHLPASMGLAASPESFAPTRDLLTKALANAAGKCDAKTRESLAHLRHGLEDLVSSNLCDKALNTMEEMKLKLKRLNGIFEAADFDNRHFQLRYQPHDAFSKRLSGFKAIRDARRHDGSLDSSLLSHADKVQFDALVDMAKLPHAEALSMLGAQCDPVANGEFDVWAMELNPQGDHRSLYSLAKQKTSSGGENQWAFTLLQVLVAASDGGSFGAAKADNPLRVIELDEAFDKLNYDRVNALMRHFEDRLGLQVLAAAPVDKSATLAPLFGRHVAVVKPGRGRPGPRASEAKISSNRPQEMAQIAQEAIDASKASAAKRSAAKLSDQELALHLASPTFPAEGSPQRAAPAARALLDEQARRAQLAPAPVLPAEAQS